MSQVVGTLEISFFDGKSETIPLEDGRNLSVGRDATNNIVLDEAGVSRLHASISASSKGIVVADSGSTNGVFLNGERLAGLRDLSSGDIVDIGSTKITVTITPPDEEAAQSDAESRMTAQLKTISVMVLVSTVQDYFSISENVSTNDMVEMLVGWSEKVREVVSRNGGMFDKFVGSSIVTLWPGEDASQQAKNALKAAVEIQAVTEELADSSKWPYQENYPWVASSVITLGRGLDKGLDEGSFSLLGDPVNLAFELESMVQKSGALLLLNSEAAELCDTEKLSQLDAEHKNKPLYSLAGVKVRD